MKTKLTISLLLSIVLLINPGTTQANISVQDSLALVDVYNSTDGPHWVPTFNPVANFVYAETGGDARGLFERLLGEGAIVRPLNGFGSDTAIRVTAGTPEENAFFADALARIRTGGPTS